MWFYSSTWKAVIMTHLTQGKSPPGLICSASYSTSLTSLASSPTGAPLTRLFQPRQALHWSWKHQECSHLWAFVFDKSHYLRIVFSWISVWLTNSSPSNTCSDPAVFNEVYCDNLLNMTTFNFSTFWHPDPALLFRHVRALFTFHTLKFS